MHTQRIKARKMMTREHSAAAAPPMPPTMPTQPPGAGATQPMAGGLSDPTSMPQMSDNMGSTGYRRGGFVE
jgi:hypothetical protein